MRYHADLQWVRMAFRNFSRTVVMGSNRTQKPICLLAEPLVSDRVAVQHKNVLRTSRRSCGEQSSRSTGREARRLRSADRTRRRISTPVRLRENSAWHSLSLQPEKLCQAFMALATVVLAVIQSTRSRNVLISDGSFPNCGTIGVSSQISERWASDSWALGCRATCGPSRHSR